MDFTNLQKTYKAYGGANGNKLSIIINKDIWMIKFPPHGVQNKEMSYTNSPISEYISCHIFEICGIKVQETMLGTYKHNNTELLVVACKDFTSPGIVLQDFASMKNQILDSPSNGFGTDLDDVLFSIRNQNFYDTEKLEDWFWDVFVIDALIGNYDRHNGNWGFLFDTLNNKISIAPVYDCGSALFPQADDKIMKTVMNDNGELKARIYSRPTSSLSINKTRINYYEFLSSHTYKEADEALLRMVPLIDMKKIDNLIDNTPYISDLEKEFYKLILNKRKEKILDVCFKKVKKSE